MSPSKLLKPSTQLKQSLTLSNITYALDGVNDVQQEQVLHHDEVVQQEPILQHQVQVEDEGVNEISLISFNALVYCMAR